MTQIAITFLIGNQYYSIEKSHNYLDTQKLIKLNIQFDGTKCYPIKTYLFHERKHLIFFVFNHFKLLLNKCFYFMNKINIILQMTNLNRDIIRKLMQYKYQNPKMISFHKHCIGKQQNHINIHRQCY